MSSCPKDRVAPEAGERVLILGQPDISVRQRYRLCGGADRLGIDRDDRAERIGAQFFDQLWRSTENVIKNIPNFIFYVMIKVYPLWTEKAKNPPIKKP